MRAIMSRYSTGDYCRQTNGAGDCLFDAEAVRFEFFASDKRIFPSTVK